MITNKFGENYYKLGLHLHTTRSDGAKSPEDIAKEYKLNGYDAVAFTDHWVYGEGGDLGGLHIIPGCEYNVGVRDTIFGVVHILSLFAQSDPAPDKNASVQEIVDAIRNKDGIAVLAHPAWSLNAPSVLIEAKGIAATEVYNAVSDANQSLRPYSDYYVDICANSEVYPLLLATDDAHYYKGEDNMRGWIMVKSEGLTDDELASAIRRGDFYASEGPELYVTKEGNKLIIDTSPCSVIGTHSNLSWNTGRVLRGTDITHFEYTACNEEKWVRVEARDKNGKKAWSNIFVL